MLPLFPAEELPELNTRRPLVPAAPPLAERIPTTPLLAISTKGPGPISTPHGELMVSAPFQIFPFRADGDGRAGHSVFVPGWTSGTTFWMHGYDPVSRSFSNPLAVTIP